MLRTVSKVPVDASSPVKPDMESTTETKKDNSEIVLNLDRNSTREKRKKKSINESSDDDDDDQENIFQNKNLDNFIDEDESRLEDLVFGSEKAIFDNISKNNKHKKNKKTGLKFNQFLAQDRDNVDSSKKIEVADALEERKPAWQDDADEEDQ